MATVEEVPSSQEKELLISYGRDPDALEFVVRLKQDLEDNGFSVWLDTQVIVCSMHDVQDTASEVVARICVVVYVNSSRSKSS